MVTPSSGGRALATGAPTGVAGRVRGRDGVVFRRVDPGLVLAEAGRRATDGHRGGVEQRERTDLGRVADCGVVDLDHAAVVDHVGHLEEFGRRQERVGAHVELAREELHPLRLRPLAHGRADQRVDLFHVGDAREPDGSVGEPRVFQEVLEADGLQPALVVVGLAGAHLDVATVGALRGHEREGDAAHQHVATLDRRRRGDPLTVASERHAHGRGRDAVEQARLEVRASPGLVAAPQGTDDPDHRQAGARVGAEGRDVEGRPVAAVDLGPA